MSIEENSGAFDIYLAGLNRIMEKKGLSPAQAAILSIRGALEFAGGDEESAQEALARIRYICQAYIEITNNPSEESQ